MEQLVVIKTLKELSDLKEYIKNKDFLSFDTETTGVQKDSIIIGFSVCAEIELAYYVILAYWDVPLQKIVYLETMSGAKDFMQALVGHSLVMQNAPFDCWMVSNNFKVELIPSVHTDTLILGHVLNENRSNALKERGVELYGEDAKAEQTAMKESVHKNGGLLTKDCYELYKADADLIAKYGAKDAILTLKVFYHDVEDLYEQGLENFFYNDESMPLLRGPTYDMNTTGLRVDPERLQNIKNELTSDCAEAMTYITKEIATYVNKRLDKKGKPIEFNIGSPQQLAWLLFFELGNEFGTLTDSGKEICEAMNWKTPYARKDKLQFIANCNSMLGQPWKQGYEDKKTGKTVKPKLISEPWKYIACDVETLGKLANKYKWVARFMEYKKNLKMLNTYVESIQEKMQYGIIRPNFMQHGTTSGRYSCKNPNFQNLPREDKRVKSCIIAREGKVFVGADYSQLEPRVFASFSGDERLLNCFKNGEDFYSVVGVEVFNRKGCSMRKDDKNSFAKLYPEERQVSKAIALAATYGATPHRLAKITRKSTDEMAYVLDNYFKSFPSVKKLMLDSHNEAKKNGVVKNLFGRPRRMPEAAKMPAYLRGIDHSELPYNFRNVLNLSVNHRIQSTGASITNRAAIAVWEALKTLAKDEPLFTQVKIVLQVHDQLVLEGPRELEAEMSSILKYCMEETVILPNVDLVAEPFASNDLSGQK